MNLKSTVNPGQRTAKVIGDVSLWPIDGFVLLTSTSYRREETEKLQIKRVTRNSITFTTPFKFKHIGK